MAADPHAERSAEIYASASHHPEAFETAVPGVGLGVPLVVGVLVVLGIVLVASRDAVAHPIGLVLLASVGVYLAVRFGVAHALADRDRA